MCCQAQASLELLAANSRNQRFLELGKKCYGFFATPLRLFQGRFFSQMWVLRRSGDAGADPREQWGTAPH